MTIKLTPAQKIKVLMADDLYSVMQQVLRREKKIDRDKEHCWLVSLSSSNHILLIELISLGSVNATIVTPMDVFSFALQKRAVKIIMVHNHPSGDLRPSTADKELTEKMMAIGKFIHVPLVDHLIISEEGFYSFEESGLLKKMAAETKYDLNFTEVDALKKEIEKAQLKTENIKLKIATSLLKNGVPVKTIMQSTGLTKREVEELGK